MDQIHFETHDVDDQLIKRSTAESIAADSVQTSIPVLGYDSGTNYLIDQYVFFEHSTEGMNIYRCIVATSAGESPETTPASWAKLITVDMSPYMLKDGSVSFTAPVSGVDPTSATHLTTKQWVEALIALAKRLEPVLSRQVDNTLDPSASPTEGDAYIIEDAGNLHANFGSIPGVGNNDRVQYIGSAFAVTYDASVAGEGANLYVEDENKFYMLNDSAWVESTGTTAHGSLSGLTSDHHTQYLLLSGRGGQTINDDIGLGGAPTFSKLDVVRASNNSIALIDNRAVALGIGGGVIFGGNYTGSTPTSWGRILGLKENGTDGEYGGYLVFEVRPNGGSLTEAMRIVSNGNIGLGGIPTTFANYVTLALNHTNGAVFEGQSGGTKVGYVQIDGNGTEIGADGARYIRFLTNGAERARIDSAGNVGIGGSPSKKLEINDLSNLRFEVGVAGTVYQQTNTENLVLGTRTTDCLFIMSDGKIGIGTVPTHALHVLKSADARVAVATGDTGHTAFQQANNSGTMWLAIDDVAGASYSAGAYSRVLYSTGAYPFIIFTNSVERLRVDSGGSTTIKNTSGSTLTLNKAGSPASLALQDNGTETGQLAAISGGGILFYRGSSPTESLRIDSNGNISAAYHPMFHIISNSSMSNATGDGNAFTPTAAYTEVVDRGGDVSAWTFTVPVTGTYLFNVYVDLDDLDAAAYSWIDIYLGGTANYKLYYSDIAVQDGGKFQICLSRVLNLTSGDTVKPYFNVGTSTLSVDILEVQFSGRLLI